MTCTSCLCPRCGENPPAEGDDFCTGCHEDVQREWLLLLAQNDARNALYRELTR